MRASTGSGLPGIVSQPVRRAGSFHFPTSMHQPSVLAVIMGGGRGTRLYPLTKERCKPAVPPLGNTGWSISRSAIVLNSGINPHLPVDAISTRLPCTSRAEHLHFDSFGRGLSTSWRPSRRKEYQLVPGHRRCRAAQFRALPHYPHDYLLILAGDQLYDGFSQGHRPHIATGPT